MQKIDETFIDDPLRILRGIRMAVKLGFSFSDLTLESMVRNVDRLSIITKERIADELNKMLMCNDPVSAMRMLVDIGAMKYVIPELCETVGLAQNHYHSSDVWEHTMSVLDLVARRPFYGYSNLETRMAALLHDIGKINTRTVDDDLNFHFYFHEKVGSEMAVEILRRLKYSNDFIDRVKFLINNHMRTKQWRDNCERMKPKKLRKLQYECGQTRFNELMTLIDADNKSHAINYCMPNQVYTIVKQTNQMIDEGTDMFDYKLPINGEDIMETKHIKPGKIIKQYLEYALKLAYNNPKISREKLLKHIKGYKISEI